MKRIAEILVVLLIILEIYIIVMRQYAPVASPLPSSVTETQKP